MSSNSPIVIKKIKKVIGGGHHGGAWKVAYADFVTAMMAFFLLMWLINTTSPEQKRGIADYFAPASVSRSTQGSDGLLGGTAFQDEGSRSSGSNRPIAETQDVENRKRSRQGGGPSEGEGEEAAASAEHLAEAEARRAQGAEFQSAETSLRQALQDMPELAELSKHVLIDQTPEGLRIQLIDQEGRAMFAGSSAEPLARTRSLLEAVAKVVEQLPNRISISGHTDSISPQQAGYSNWELSAERANAARRILEQKGVDADRIYEVRGKASSEPLYPDDPDLPANRRISILLLREAPVLPNGHEL
jgi:chemotaxis protein MotB